MDSFLEDADSRFSECPESCICQGVGLGPAIKVNKDPKKCFRIIARTIIQMARDGSNGVQKKEIKQYLQDTDLRFTHRGSTFNIVDRGLKFGMSNGYIVRKTRQQNSCLYKQSFIFHVP